MEIENLIPHILKVNYGIEAAKIEPCTGGWSALAFKVTDEKDTYFLKVYDKNRASIVRWIDAIENYTPLVKWLHDHTELKRNLADPILTNSQEYNGDDDRYVYVLSQYIEGSTIGGGQLSRDEVSELARMIGVLHKSTAAISRELKERQAKELFEIDFCDSLSSFIHDDLQKKDDIILKMVSPYTGVLLDNIERIKYVSRTLKDKTHQYVLCHADVHNWNIMRGENLMLIDWECAKLAPVEQDLILIVTEPYARQFLDEYKRHIEYNTPDLDAYEFYYLKRILEDIWEWIGDLRFEGLVKSEAETLEYLKLNLEACTRTGGFRPRIQNLFN
ncbi:aminoglycoside phosphotransferase family protein [Peribacillus sp. SCS-26]|uniref:aminoglycoside phosphotransferase family protein n=1 Tax=Paraperibacillus marinus TaxID=3115295 RepID=UPI003906B5CF